MNKTPRTDAVFEASKALPWGSIVEVPKGHPPCDPWDLARELERETNAMHLEIESYKADQIELGEHILEIKRLLSQLTGRWL